MEVNRKQFSLLCFHMPPTVCFYNVNALPSTHWRGQGFYEDCE